MNTVIVEYESDLKFYVSKGKLYPNYESVITDLLDLYGSDIKFDFRQMGKDTEAYWVNFIDTRCQS